MTHFNKKLDELVVSQDWTSLDKSDAKMFWQYGMDMLNDIGFELLGVMTEHHPVWTKEFEDGNKGLVAWHNNKVYGDSDQLIRSRQGLTLAD